jgi:hypothetical protein
LQNLIHDAFKRRSGVDDDITFGISSFVACNRTINVRSLGLPPNSSSGLPASRRFNVSRSTSRTKTVMLLPPCHAVRHALVGKPIHRFTRRWIALISQLSVTVDGGGNRAAAVRGRLTSCRRQTRLSADAHPIALAGKVLRRDRATCRANQFISGRPWRLRGPKIARAKKPSSQAGSIR